MVSTWVAPERRTLSSEDTSNSDSVQMLTLWLHALNFILERPCMELISPFTLKYSVCSNASCETKKLLQKIKEELARYMLLSPAQERGGKRQSFLYFYISLI